MESSLIDIVKTLGITGFALWIMWRMYELSSQRFKEKDELYAEERAEREKAMRDLEKEVRVSIIAQLSENTRAFQRVMEHINNHEK